MDRDVSKIFNAFAGRHVMPPFTKARDLTVEELHKEAAAHGYSVRVIYPGQPITEDYCETRVNVHVVKTKDGWRVGKKFELF